MLLTLTKPAKRAKEGDISVEIPSNKRQKKITSLLQPTKESLHLRDEDSDTDVKNDEAAPGHPDEARASSVREEVSIAVEIALELVDGRRVKSETAVDAQHEAKEKNSGEEDSEPSDSAPLSKFYKISCTIRLPTPKSKTPSRSPSHSPTPQRADSPDLTKSSTSSPIRNLPSPHPSTEPTSETEHDQSPNPTDEELTEPIHLNTHIRYPSETPTPHPLTFTIP